MWGSVRSSTRRNSIATAQASGPPPIVVIVEVDEADTGHERSKRMSILLLPGSRQRTECPPVKGIFQREQAPLGFVAVVVFNPRQGTRQLQSAFPGFSSAVAEKCLVEAGDLRQPLRQFRLILVVEEIGNVNQPAGLLFQSARDRRMRVAQGVYANPAEKIQIALAARVPQVHAASASKQHPLAIVSGQQQFLFGAHY